jgi:hypothetical protein
MFLGFLDNRKRSSMSVADLWPKAKLDKLLQATNYGDAARAINKRELMRQLKSDSHPCRPNKPHVMDENAIRSTVQ